MKILMVNKFLYPKGGAETYMLDLGKCLTSKGNEVEYFGMDCTERAVSNSAESYACEIDYSASTLFKKLSLPLKTIYSKEAAKKIALVLDSFKPDIVHLNNINFQLTPSIIYEIKKRRIPIVQTVHDVQIACPNHRFYIETQEKICEECEGGKFSRCIKNKCVHNSSLQSAVAAAESYYYHKRKTYNLIDKYICPSQFIADSIHKAGIDKSKLIVLHNYSVEVNPQEYTEIKKEKYILYFGRISVEKGLKLLFDVLEETPDIQLVLAGRGPLEEELKARNLKNAEFLGFKSGDELKRLVANAVCSVCPSQWYENCPMSVIESLSLGTPVITCDIGGTKELIKNGKNGLVYKAEDRVALKEALERIYFDDKLAENMRNYCLTFPATHTLDEYSEKITELYSGLIKE